MRNVSQSTLVGTVRTAVSEWRKREGWSRETVTQEIVEAHERAGADKVTGIVFDPTTRDPFGRMKVNADRVQRWLDDETKDTNLLPSNFLPSILLALPMDLRLQCVGDLLRPLGLDVRSSESTAGGNFDAHSHVSALIKESSEASRALLAAGQGDSIAAYEAAQKELQDVQEATSNTMRALRSAMTTMRKGVIGFVSRG